MAYFGNHELPLQNREVEPCSPVCLSLFGFGNGALSRAPAYVQIAATLKSCHLLSHSDKVWLQEHIKVGQAISPLRDEGVLVVGSGSSYHGMGLGGSGAAASRVSRCL